MEREIKIYSSKILNLLNEKDELVKAGRKESQRILDIEKEIAELDTQERKYTTEANPEELIQKGNALKDEINDKIKQLEEIGKQVETFKINAIPKELRDKHYTLRDLKEKLEKERNKIALKVQKIKDRVIPLIEKEVKKLGISEFEQIAHAVPKKEAVAIKIVDVVEQFKETYKKANAQK